MKSRVKELLHALAMGRRDVVDELADLLCGTDVQSPDEVYGKQPEVIGLPVVGSTTAPAKKVKAK